MGDGGCYHRLVPSPGVTTGILERIFSRLGVRWLALLAGTLFILDLVVPDPIPFVDELLLALVTIFLAQLPSARLKEPAPAERPMKNVTPPRE